ncbi:glycosyltransferase [Limnobacter sp.]|uniref:glycosyltransferase family protein n=1 Tax=Limnobacter sp. TaxID=2003368 RepID=UPI003517F20B
MKILYSYNKNGFEAIYWDREIRSASNDQVTFVPFNHGQFLDPSLYLRAQQLDNLYYKHEVRLMHMYKALKEIMRAEQTNVLLVDNCHPYHPEFLRTLDTYKVIRTTDGPSTAYDRDFAYVHAYDHVLYHSPAYSRDLTMAEKLDYCGAKRHDLWPLAVFDQFCCPQVTEERLMSMERDIDIIFVGALYLDKMPFLASIRKAFGKRFQVYGLASVKKNLYFNFKYRTPIWVTPIRFEDYVPLYRRTKLGVNAHLRGKFTVGNYRLFDLPANGVAQLSDGGEYLQTFYEVGLEIRGYDEAEDLIPQLDHLLTHPRERKELAREGFLRTMADHRVVNRLRQLPSLIAPYLGN